MANRTVEVTLGTVPDAKYYRVHYSDDEVASVEAIFYGYRGRMTYRAVKKDGAAWRKVTKHLAELQQTPKDYDCCSVHHLAHPCEACVEVSQYEEVIADHNRLVRELDVLLNGEDGAAKQASLCDIVSQVRGQVETAMEMRKCLEAIDNEFVDPLEPWGPDLELPRDWLLGVREVLARGTYSPKYELHGYLVYETKFGGHWEFHPKDDLPAGDFLKHRQHTPVYIRAK